jgi:Tol biopolymer transport system component
MIKILHILIITLISIHSNAITVEISKNYDWDILYFESNLTDLKNDRIIKNITNFDIKEVIRPIKNCDLVDYSKKNNTCFRVEKKALGVVLTYRNLKDIQKKSIKDDDTLVISDFLYQNVFNKESPFLTNIVFSGQHIINEKLEHSIYISNINGSKTKKIFTSKKSIVSLSLNPDKKTLAYISYENIYPKIFLHDILSNKRVLLNKIPGKVNSLNWDISGENLLLSIKNKKSSYNLYKFNVKNSKFSQLTDFEFDAINPREYKKNQFVYTAIIGKQPKAYMSDISKRTTTKLNISKRFSYISDINSEKDRTLVMNNSNGKFSLLLLKKPDSKEYKKIFTSEYMESPKFIKNKKYFLLTIDSKFGNTIIMANMYGEIKRRLSFKNIKVTELEIL